jgi:hypothetical protein
MAMINQSAMVGKTTSTGTSTNNLLEENVLHKYASYNYLWTLSVLSRDEITNPDRITKNKVHDVIAKSGGIGTEGNFSSFNAAGDTARAGQVIKDTNKEATTTYDKASATTIQSQVHSDQILRRGHDIFFERVILNGVNQPNEQRKLMNFNKIEMELHEPYGVTLFEKMRAAAFNNGYFDHIDCPYLLTLDFRGYDNLGKPLSVITTRYLPLKITNVEMEINQGGTVYTMTGVPWTDFAMLDRYLYTRSASSLDLKRIFTLGTALKELSNKLNEQQELEIAAGQREYYDTYEIDCDPNTDLAGLTASASNNWELKNAVAGFNASIRPNVSIAKVITDMCLKADKFRDISKIVEKYWKDLAAVQAVRETASTLGEDPDPMVPWFKIITTVYNNTEFDTIRKVHRKTIRFRVKEYKIHVMNFTVPGLSASELWGKHVRKSYKWLYTGENQDILDLKINYKYGYMQSSLFDGSRSDGVTAKSGKDLSVPEIVRRYGNRSTDFPEPLLPLQSHPNTQKSEDGATDDGASRTEVDRFFDYLTSPMGDMVNVQMTILGDPAFIGQDFALPIPQNSQGVVDQLGRQGTVTEKTVDAGYRSWDPKLGCFNFDQSEVFVRVDFRYPTDISEKQGVMNFNNFENVHFSGLYKVVQVESRFEQGKFTQVLDMVRYNNQGKAINVAQSIREATDKRDGALIKPIFDFLDALGNVQGSGN